MAARKKSDVSKKYSNFDAEIRSFALEVRFNLARYGISSFKFFPFYDKYTLWDGMYYTYKDPTTRTKPQVLTLENMYKELRKELSEMQQQIKNDKSIVPLTPKDRQKVGIHADKETRTRATTPTSAPKLEEVSATSRANRFKTDEIPAKMRLLIRVAYLPAGTEPQESDYTIIKESGRATFKLTAPPEVSKGTVGYIKAAYVNTRGEKGPESRPISFVVN